MAVLGLLVTAALGGARPTQAQVTSFNAYLAPGFNNVAYLGPTQPVEAAIAPIAGSVSRVYAWDADIQAYQFYDASFPFSTLTQLEPGQSLWIYVTNSAGVSWSQAVGAMSSSTPLRADFNLVTWTGSDGTPVTEAFGNLALERAWVYNTDIGRYDSYTPGALSFLNRLTTLDFGDGVRLLLPFGQTWQIGGGGEAASVEAITEDYAVSARTGAAAQDAFLDFASQFAQATSGVRDPSEIERLVGEAQARAIIANPSAAANLATTDAVLDGFITTFDASGVSSAQSGTPGVSVRFVNGVLNSAEAAAGGAQSLSGILGVPVTLSYNHSLLETSGLRGQRLLRGADRGLPVLSRGRSEDRAERSRWSPREGGGVGGLDRRPHLQRRGHGDSQRTIGGMRGDRLWLDHRQHHLPEGLGGAL